MSDRELLEKFYSEFSAFKENISRDISALRTNTESNFDRLFEGQIRIEKRLNNLDQRIGLLTEELTDLKVQTKSRLDRLEARVE